ncbi:MAG TPA: galactokinase, partial [Vicinamibacterales bacterium]|nr:galactokinase [Vicinamibacterales bacterium]
MARTAAGEGIARSFEQVFGRRPEAVASAPGRVNLIGEHTDYNGGFVLPIAIPQRTWTALARSEGNRVRVWSASITRSRGIESYQLGREAKARRWYDYVQGCTQALQQQGLALCGFDLAIASTVPLGSGLSSSAALEVAVLRGLRDLFGLEIDDLAVAKIGQQAENEFVGAPVGLMDQMAASLAGEDAALFLDTRTLRFETVPLPAGTSLLVLNSGVAHHHASGDYRTRRAECERAAQLLGVAQLRDIGMDDLARVNALPEPLNRRARHVVTENQRVLDAVAAMKKGDPVRLGALFDASHASQRDDYQVSVPEIDALVEAARAQPGVFGARLTGGGFGGSIVALVRAEDATRAAE